MLPSETEGVRGQPVVPETYLRPKSDHNLGIADPNLGSVDLNLRGRILMPSETSTPLRRTLTDVGLRAFIKSPPPRQTDIVDASTPGLSARINSTGHIKWCVRIRIAGEGGQSKRGLRAKGQQYRISLGSYPTVTIKEARAKATEYARQAEAGEHPVRALERKAISRNDTVERLVEDYLTDYALPSLKSWPCAKSYLNNHIVPHWGKLPVDAIDERDVARVLSGIAKGEIDPETGKRAPRPGAAAEARKWGRSLCSWAIKNGRASRNPFAPVQSPAKQKVRQRFLDLEEARAVWRSTANLDRPWREIVQLLMLTGCRHREIAHARWSWVSEKEARMVIPAEVYKTERPFLLALPKRAFKILISVPRWSKGDCIFSTTGGVDPVWCVPRKIVDKLHKDAEQIAGRKIEHFVIHDFRRTVRTHLARLKVSEVVGELVLGHALKGISATYNVYDFEDEKREALSLWEAELVSLPTVRQRAQVKIAAE